MTKRFSPEDLNQHRSYLVAYALRQMGDRDTAQDVVQDTLVAALTTRQAFAGRSALRTWLVGILRHKIMDHYRERSRTPASLDALLDEGIDADIDTNSMHRAAAEYGIDPAQSLEHKRFWETFERELSRMPARMAEAFVLSELSSLDTKALCKKLGVTSNLLWVMRFRAKEALRAGMAPAYSA